jgi:molecular chaperone GrpE
MKDFKDRHDQDDLELENEDTAFDAELEDIEENSVGKIKQLQKQLKECEKEKMEHLENLQRAKADFLNGKRRLEEERLRDKERAVSAQIEKLIPLCDSFQMAKNDKEAWDAIDETWRKGVEGIYNQLQAILSSYGVKEVRPLGEAFDPNIHEAMTNMPVENADDHHKIMSVIQNGFIRTIGNKQELIRPARVIVGEYTGSSLSR